MLTVHQLAKSYSLKTLFNNITFSLNPGDRVGLVGVNGCGKTTLLRIIAGVETADSGHITIAPYTRLGYLTQGFELDLNATLAEVVGRAAGDIDILEAELAELALALAEQPHNEQLQTQYDDILQRVSTADTGRAAAILAGLDLADVPPDLQVRQLSGGQKTRLKLALVLLNDPQLLLLDEPTNHLDIETLEWLESWLADFAGGALIVSHDRTFLDRTVTRILAMDAQQQSVTEYAGSYSDYEAQVAHERELQWAAYKDQQQEIRRIKQDIAQVRAQAEKTERQASSVRRGGEMMKLKGYKDYQQSIAKKVAKKAKAREGKLERFLEDEERVERPSQSRNIRLDFADTAHLGQSVIRLMAVSVGFAGERPLLTNLNLDIAAAARIVLTGPNGSGKTTLLRTLAHQLPPLAGAIEQGPTVKLGYMTQEQRNLDLNLSPVQTIQHAFPTEEAARTFLAYFLFTKDEPLKPNSQLSFGQRARLELALMVADGCNVLLLDEPTNHLDIPSRTQFEEALATFDGTILTVIHDRYFIERFADEIWWIENGRIRRT
ncbi:MAG: ABC-F family ATP-binding cassette domain-containing protein [Ardenticatenaceae bacterium]|nr:ABC-F family ATP-binding cassette domain-containing protein [Ardenticatenaceae bacterium]